MRRRLLVLAGATGLLVVGVLGVLPTGAPPAVADSTQCSIAASGAAACAAGAEFVSYGEHLYVRDQRADGHSAVVRYWLDGGTGPFHVWNSGGNGTSVDHNLELAEGSWIFYQVCVGEYGIRDVWTSTCSVGVTDYA
jgi:hypothetical protein